MQPVAAGCITFWGPAMPLMLCSYTSTLLLILPTSKDDRPSHPHLVLIQQPTGAQIQQPTGVQTQHPENLSQPLKTVKPTPGL